MIIERWERPVEKKIAQTWPGRGLAYSCGCERRRTKGRFGNADAADAILCNPRAISCAGLSSRPAAVFHDGGVAEFGKGRGDGLPGSRFLLGF